jgi:hypothetical protein
MYKAMGASSAIFRQAGNAGQQLDATLSAEAQNCNCGIPAGVIGAMMISLVMVGQKCLLVHPLLATARQ